MTPAELLDRPDVLLGGRVAEELVFGDISTGAQDDLQRATDMARHMGHPLRHERGSRARDDRRDAEDERLARRLVLALGHRRPLLVECLRAPGLEADPTGYECLAVAARIGSAR